MRAAMKMDQKQHAAALERQVGGDHYRTTSIQPWEVIDAWKLNFYEGNALKYLQRWRRKGGVADLRKLIHYIERLIELEEKNASPQENQER